MQNSQTNTFLKGMNLDTAKEFVGTEQYIDAQNVHVVTTDGGTSGALQPYADWKIIESSELNGHTILGTTIGKIHKKHSIIKDLIPELIECFMVFTEHNGSNFLTLFHPDDFKVLWKLRLNVGYKTRTKLINLYESSEISRVYMCCENSDIIVVNVNCDPTQYDDNTDFSIFPKCGALPPFVFNAVVKGNKVAGKVQYAYQLFDTYGRTTALSAISHTIPIGNELSQEQTTEGISIELSGLPKGYTHLRLFSIRYTTFEDLPRVYIKDEIPINSSAKVIYQDTDDTFLSEYTIEQFQAIKSVQFKANTIETAKNRLFAAGISDNTWDVQFDARVFSANDQGNVQLVDPSGKLITLPLQDVVQQSVDENITQDNFNSDYYKYNTLYGRDVVTGKYPEGGAGPNVSYLFVHPLLYLAPNIDGVRSDNGYNILSDDTKQNKQSDVQNITLLQDNLASNEWQSSNSIAKGDVDHVIDNVTYEDPYICANYTGFKQGEYYTFGIVFYNHSHMPSPVHPIGTIHIPYFENWIFGGAVTNDGNYHDLLATTVGIRFKIKLTEEIKKQAVAYEIVRVQNTTDTRHVLFQGLVSKALRYIEEIKGSGKSLGDQDTRCPLYPTLSSTFYSLYSYDSRYRCGVNLLNDGLVFISPEVSINKENISNSLRFAKTLKVTNKLSSIMRDSRDLQSLRDGDYCPLFSHVKHATVPGTSYTLDGKSYVHDRYAGIPFINRGGIHDFVGVSSSKTNDAVGYSLFKYYIPSPTNAEMQIHSLDFCGTLPVDQLGDSSIQHPVMSTRTQFVNVTTPSNIPGQDYGRIGLHCNCLYIALQKDQPAIHNDDVKLNMRFNWNQSDNFTSFVDADPIYESAIDRDSENGFALTIIGNAADQRDVIWKTSRCTVALTDVCSAYVPNHSYAKLASLNYVSTGQYGIIDSKQDNAYINCFGGDTYVGIYSELWSGFGYDSAYESKPLSERDCVNIKYPVETRINIGRIYGPNFDTSQPNPMLTFEPGQLLQYGSQDLPLNAYNSAYSASEYNKVFVTRGTYDVENQNVINRIMASELKSTGELSDSYQDFKVANYIDVDNRYGQITNLVKYKDRLYYLQSTAFGTVAVNERSLITDNNQAALLLGTGDVLARYDNISTFDGSDVVNDSSVLVSPSSLYWYDSNKKSLCVFNEGGLNSLSKVKQAQSYFNSLNKDHVVHSGYDTKNNEVWFHPEGKSRSIIYSEQVQAFTGFYTMPVKFAQVASEFSIGINGNNFVQFGKKSDQKLADCYVKFVVNKEPAIPKVYDSMMLSDCYTPAFSKFVIPFNVACATNRQGPVSGQYPNSVTNREGVYYISIGRDQNKERMRDKTMIVQLTFEDTNFNVPFVNTIYRYSRI